MLKHISLAVILIICYFLWEQRPVKYGPGIVAESEPRIEKITFSRPIETKNYIITPRYEIEGTVRVIAQKNYWFDEMRHISPTDLIIAWDRMSNDELLSKMLININERSYSVQMAKPPFMRSNIHDYLIMAHSIPSSELIHEKLVSLRRGQLISFSGYIVDVENRTVDKWISPVRDGFPAQRSPQWIWFEELFIEEPDTENADL